MNLVHVHACLWGFGYRPVLCGRGSDRAGNPENDVWPRGGCVYGDACAPWCVVAVDLVRRGPMVCLTGRVLDVAGCVRGPVRFGARDASRVS